MTTVKEEEEKEQEQRKEKEQGSQKLPDYTNTEEVLNSIREREGAKKHGNQVAAHSCPLTIQYSRPRSRSGVASVL